MNKLEDLARRLCLAEGMNPDARVYRTPLPVNMRGYQEAVSDPVEMWQTYLSVIVMTAHLFALDSTKQEPKGQMVKLYDLLNEILSQPAEADAEQMPDPPPAPDWRFRRGL